MISGPACKELEGCHCVPTSRKLNKLKNQLFLDPSENWGSWGKLLPSKLGDNENHKLPEQNPVYRNPWGNLVPG